MSQHPAQLVMAGGGFQYFFIGPDGNTVSGPTIPSFADLAEMHPSGEWVSLLDAVNPLSGKQVYVDYIPKDMKIRVFTYYPDKGMDVDKPYIFNFGSDLIGQRRSMVSCERGAASSRRHQLSSWQPPFIYSG